MKGGCGCASVSSTDLFQMECEWVSEAVAYSHGLTPCYRPAGAALFPLGLTCPVASVAQAALRSNSEHRHSRTRTSVAAILKESFAETATLKDAVLLYLSIVFY